jgi:hypothetical protein
MDELLPDAGQADPDLAPVARVGGSSEEARAFHASDRLGDCRLLDTETFDQLSLGGVGMFGEVHDDELLAEVQPELREFGLQDTSVRPRCGGEGVPNRTAHGGSGPTARARWRSDLGSYIHSRL